MVDNPALCREPGSLPPPLSLTRDQLDAARIIQEFLDTTGTVPSIRELQRELGMTSRSSVVGLVDGLVRRGWLRHTPKQHRSLVLLHRPPMPHFDEPAFILGAPAQPAQLAQVPA